MRHTSANETSAGIQIASKSRTSRSELYTRSRSRASSCSPLKTSASATAAGHAVRSGNSSSSCCAGSTRCPTSPRLPPEHQRLRAPHDERVGMVGGDADLERLVREALRVVETAFEECERRLEPDHEVALHRLSQVLDDLG